METEMELGHQGEEARKLLVTIPMRLIDIVTEPGRQSKQAPGPFLRWRR
jgi:transcriptional regulator of met regulon